MPALAKPPVSLPRFVPHVPPGVNAGAGLTISRTAPRATIAVLQPESLEHLAHDARNVLSGLMLCSELLALPGVLAQQHGHYAQELQSIAKNAAQIIERMAAAHNSRKRAQQIRILSPPLRSHRCPSCP